MLTAAEWARNGKDNQYLWPHERLIKVYNMLQSLQVELDDVTNEFIKPEFTRLTQELFLEVSHERRAYIGDRLNEIGDNRPGVN